MKIFFLGLIMFFQVMAKGYPILDPGDPDLTAEKIAVAEWNQNQSENIKKPFILKNPKTFFERGLLKRGHRLCFVGDTGNGSARQKKIAHQMKYNCDQIRHLGDLIYYTGAQNVEDPVLKERFLDIYKDLKIPMYIAIGNHDYYKNPEVWLKVSQDYPNKYIFPNNYYMEFFSHPGRKGLCFITLDTIPLASFPYPARAKEQLKWISYLPNLIRNRCNKVFSFGHHPYAAPQQGRDQKTSKALRIGLFEKRLFKFVHLIVAGHDHFLAYYKKQPSELFPGKFYRISEIVTGAGGMLNTESEIGVRNYGVAFRETGFVQMTLLNDSNHPHLKGKIRFLNHEGIELYQTEGP